MKRWVVLSTFAFASLCFADEAEVRKLFAQAGQTYDTGQFKEAAEHYEQILQHGYQAPELFYNLGNAYFKQGDAGHAILNFRRAWTMTPRDPELSANLRFAIQNAAAIAPEASIVTNALSHFSITEWIRFALFGYWGVATAAILYFLAKSRRVIFMRLAAVALVVLLVSLAGVCRWWDYRRKPELVVTAPNQQALFAPLANSTPHFALPPGSIVRLEETSGPWIRVASGRESGWIRQSACEPVLSWFSAEHT